jgi:hypothetical protein
MNHPSALVINLTIAVDGYLGIITLAEGEAA